MMVHEKCVSREKLFAYASHLLDRREESEISLHIGACEACGRVLAQYQRLDATLDEWKPAAPSGAFDARVRAAVALQKVARPGFAFLGLRWAQMLAPACLLVLVVAASLILSHSRRHPVHVANTPAISQSVAEPGSPAEQELTMYQDLPILEDEDYEMLADFDVLSEVPRGDSKLAN